jgi:hypothetical protein
MAEVKPNSLFQQAYATSMAPNLPVAQHDYDTAQRMAEIMRQQSVQGVNFDPKGAISPIAAALQGLQGYQSAQYRNEARDILKNQIVPAQQQMQQSMMQQTQGINPVAGNAQEYQNTISQLAAAASAGNPSAQALLDNYQKMNAGAAEQAWRTGGNFNPNIIANAFAEQKAITGAYEPVQMLDTKTGLNSDTIAGNKLDQILRKGAIPSAEQPTVNVVGAGGEGRITTQANALGGNNVTTASPQDTALNKSATDEYQVIPERVANRNKQVAIMQNIAKYADSSSANNVSTVYNIFAKETGMPEADGQALLKKYVAQLNSASGGTDQAMRTFSEGNPNDTMPPEAIRHVVEKTSNLLRIENTRDAIMQKAFEQAEMNNVPVGRAYKKIQNEVMDATDARLAYYPFDSYDKLKATLSQGGVAAQQAFESFKKAGFSKEEALAYGKKLQKLQQLKAQFGVGQ